MRAIFAVAVLFLVGCGVQAPSAHTTPARHRPATSAKPTVPAGRQVSCVHLRATPSLRTVTLSYADNKKSFCVTRGTGIFVFLRGQTPQLWTVIQASSAALERRPSGVMSLMRGETGAFFEAVGPGAATLTSFESRCPSGPRPGERQPRRCPAPLRFSVTVHVVM